MLENSAGRSANLKLFTEDSSLFFIFKDNLSQVHLNEGLAKINN